MYKLLPHNRPEERNGTVLEVNGLKFVYPPPRPVVAIENINFCISSREYVAIIGENGSGKTTLARCISTYLKPTKGSIAVVGRNLFQTPIRERPLYMGYVFQNPDRQLFKDSVWDDVAFSLQNLGYPPNIIAETVDMILEDLDLAGKATKHPIQLSKGERQCLAVASIAVMQPAVIIIDEPTTGLDAVHSYVVMQLCNRFRNQLGMTIIVITHNMELVTEYCDRAIVIGGGRILLDDTPANVFKRPELLAKTHIEPPPIPALFLRLGLNDHIPLLAPEAAEQLLEHRL